MGLPLGQDHPWKLPTWAATITTSYRKTKRLDDWSGAQQLMQAPPSSGGCYFGYSKGRGQNTKGLVLNYHQPSNPGSQDDGGDHAGQAMLPTAVPQ